MGIALAFVVGSILTASLFAAARLLSASTRVLSPESEAMRAAVYAATATLPYLRMGLSRESAGKSIAHLHALTQAASAMIAGGGEILAVGGSACEEFRVGGPLPEWLQLGRDDRLHVEPRLRERAPASRSIRQSWRRWLSASAGSEA